jgi:hypothetical protein
VVAGRPSSTPAAANAKAPVQMETKRAPGFARANVLRTNEMSLGFGSAMNGE